MRKSARVQRAYEGCYFMLCAFNERFEQIKRVEVDGLSWPALSFGRQNSAIIFFKKREKNEYAHLCTCNI